jgi:hypothetical protein
MPAIYHFTDIENLQAILSAGELRSHAAAACVVDIADETIKSRRARTEVPCGPRGMICDYVPFYFAPRSPMLFSIKSGNVDGVSSEQTRLVYVVSSTEVVLGAGLRHVFTDGNAAAAFTSFHTDLARLAAIVDWPLLRARYWSNTPEDSDRRRRRGAELLIHEALPLGLVSEFGVYDLGVRTRVAQAVDDAGSDIPVRVRRDWYF